MMENMRKKAREAILETMDLYWFGHNSSVGADDLEKLKLLKRDYLLTMCLWLLMCFYMILMVIFYFNWRFKRPVLNLPVETMIVLGSGGHTKEIVSVLEAFDPRYFTPRIYVIGHSDTLSMEKIIFMESERGESEDTYSFVRVHRIREVGQNWISVIFFSLPLSIIQSMRWVFYYRPECIVANGPGICVPIVYMSIFLRVFARHPVAIMYIESVCRVSSLSLTGALMIRIADYFVVQWGELKRKYPKTIFVGRLS